MPSSRMLRSRSCALRTRSFSNFRASLSAFVSRRGSRAGSRGSELPPRPRNDELPRPFLELYTPLPVRSCEAPLGAAVVGEMTCWALDRRVCPRDEGCDSFPWLLPMMDCRGKWSKQRDKYEPGSKMRRASYQSKPSQPKRLIAVVPGSVRARMGWLSRGEASERTVVVRRK